MPEPTDGVDESHADAHHQRTGDTAEPGAGGRPQENRSPDMRDAPGWKVAGLLSATQLTRPAASPPPPDVQETGGTAANIFQRIQNDDVGEHPVHSRHDRIHAAPMPQPRRKDPPCQSSRSNGN